MRGFELTHSPPDGWTSACEDQHAVFGSVAWQELLERGFECRTIYLWNGTSGAAITVFKAGPFRIGYLGFPAGAFLGAPQNGSRLIEHIVDALRDSVVDCIRVPASAFGPRLELNAPFTVTPETAIADLQTWDVSKVSTNTSRNIKKARRGMLHVCDTRDSGDGSRIYRIYADTIRRHRGSLRYTESYFRNLVELASARSNIRVLIGLADNDMAGFTVVLKHSVTSYYLHGGTARSLQHLQPSALLLNEAIQWGAEQGCDTFNFMSSPARQPSLVRYKEGWGAETRHHKTYTVPVSVAGKVFAGLERVVRLTR